MTSNDSRRIDTARFVAAQLHDGKLDRGGIPYFYHLSVVVGILQRRWPDAPTWAVDAAWLHDVLEDTDATPDYLREQGISDRAIEIIEAVTRPSGVTYRKWIADLAASGNVWAIRVKLADNEHNSDPTRALPGSDIVKRRYIPAKIMLETAEAKLCQNLR